MSAAINVLEHFHELTEIGIKDAYEKSKAELLNLPSIDINEENKNGEPWLKYLAQGHECCNGCLDD